MFCQIIQVMLIGVPEYNPALVEDVKAWLNFLGGYSDLFHKAWELLGVSMVTIAPRESEHIVSCDRMRIKSIVFPAMQIDVGAPVLDNLR